MGLLIGDGLVTRCTVGDSLVIPTAPFSPDQVAGLALWLKADAGTSTTVDGAAVSQWDDQSGNARHVTQATGANQPVYKTAIVNGKPVVRFDGANDFLQASFTLSQPGASSEFAADGGTAATGNTGSNSAAGVTLGGRPDGNQMGPVDIAEVLIYSALLATGDRDNIESYLGAKYGITVA